MIKDATGATVRTESYHYDADGNRNSAGYVVGPNNEVQSDGTFTYHYDDEGNLDRKTVIASKAVTTYAYDFRDRLILVEERSAAGVLLVQARYVYDVDGRRIAEVVNGVATHFVYNGNNVWADIDATGKVIARYLFGDRTDELLARRRTGEGTVWYLTDKQGTVRDLAGALGNTVNHVEYDGFGNVVVQTSPAAGDRYLFTGREFAPETGLYYYRARYYDPSSGRFISQDPIGLGGDQNLYRYVYNSVHNATDPLGLLAMLDYVRFFSPASPNVPGAIIGFLQGFGATNLIFLGQFLAFSNARQNPLDHIQEILRNTRTEVDATRRRLGVLSAIGVGRNPGTPGFIGSFANGVGFRLRILVVSFGALNIDPLRVVGIPSIPIGPSFGGFGDGSEFAFRRLESLFGVSSS